MSVVRMNKTENFTVMSNFHFKEKKMSLKAKGLLSLMLSLPNDWDYSISGLVSICKENETAIKNTLNELQKFGYLIVSKLMPNKEEKRSRIEYIYDIFESPQEVKKQPPENLPLENQPVDNRVQLSTNEQSTNEQSTNDAVINSFNSCKSKEKKPKSNKTPWKKVQTLFGLDRRSPSIKEKESATRWVDEWEMPDELILEAYNRCIDSIGKYRNAYIDKVLEQFHTHSIKTIEQANEARAMNKSKYGKKESDPSYNINEYEKWDMFV